MEEKTVIIAHRRRGSNCWEGYTERAETESNSWVDYLHSIGQIVKVFSGISEFRATGCSTSGTKKGSGLKVDLMCEASSFVTGLLLVSKANIRF